MSNLDNILVNQKDMILTLVNESLDLMGTDWQKGIAGLYSALAMLRVNRELWISEKYGYKLNEILRRIDDAQDELSLYLPTVATKKRRDLGNLYRICKSLYASTVEASV